jgi:hypothetical protein
LQITWPEGNVTNMIESAAMIALFADTFAEARLAPEPRDLSEERVDYLQVLYFGATIDWILWQIRLQAFADARNFVLEVPRDKPVVQMVSG